MAVFTDPLDALSSFQQALDAFRTSSWLDAGLSGGGAYPPVNVFRKGDDFIIIAEVPGVKKSEIDVQVKGRTIRLSGGKDGRLSGEGGAASTGAARRPVRSGGHACPSRSIRTASRPSIATAFSLFSCRASERRKAQVDQGGVT